MESDDLFDKIRDRIKDSEMHYAPQANKAYSRIWNAVEKDENKVSLFWYKCISVAAIILLLFTSSALFILIQRGKAEAIALKHEIKSLHLLTSRLESGLKFKEEKTEHLSSQSQVVEDEAVKNALAVQGQDAIERDTIYITKVKEVVKIVEPAIALEPAITLIPPIIIEQAGSMLPESLETVEVKIEQPETPKLHFIFADNENQKKNKKAFGLRFRLGNPGGSANESYTRTKPLSIHANL